MRNIFGAKKKEQPSKEEFPKEEPQIVYITVKEGDLFLHYDLAYSKFYKLVKGVDGIYVKFLKYTESGNIIEETSSIKDGDFLKGYNIVNNYCKKNKVLRSIIDLMKEQIEFIESHVVEE